MRNDYAELKINGTEWKERKNRHQKKMNIHEIQSAATLILASTAYEFVFAFRKKF